MISVFIEDFRHPGYLRGERVTAFKKRFFLRLLEELQAFQAGHCSLKSETTGFPLTLLRKPVPIYSPDTDITSFLLMGNGLPLPRRLTGNYAKRMG